MLNPISTLAASHKKQATLQMKPTALITSRSRRDSFDRALGKCNRQPRTDYSYHGGVFDQSSAFHPPVYARSLWNIASDYFKHEARHAFCTEALCFAIITLTAALSLINNLHALIQFVRAITSH
jgi:hypothetical protein